MKNIMTLLLAFACLVGVSAKANTYDPTNPYQLMSHVSDQLFARLKADQNIIKSNPNHLKTVVEDELMPYVNDRYAALKLLGSNLKGADKAEVDAFAKEFRAYLVTSYAQALAQYTNQSVIVEGEKNVPSDRSIVKVNVDIVSPSAPKINLNFTLLKDKNTSHWKAYDMTAEGVSLLSTKQAEWNQSIRQKGLPAVTQDIAQMAKQNIVLGQ